MQAGRGGPAASLNLSGAPSAPSTTSTPRTATPGGRAAGNDFAAKADSIGLGGPKTSQAEQFAPQAVQALGGSNHDVVKNRAAIRMANMSAAETLKAELAGLVPLKPSASSFKSPPAPAVPPPQPAPDADGEVPPVVAADAELADEDNEVPGLGAGPNVSDVVINMDEDERPPSTNGEPESPHGTKRKHDVVEAEDEEVDAEETLPIEDDDDDDADATAATNYALKVNPDGTVEQEDTVR